MHDWLVVYYDIMDTSVLCTDKAMQEFCRNPKSRCLRHIMKQFFTPGCIKKSHPVGHTCCSVCVLHHAHVVPVMYCWGAQLLKPCRSHMMSQYRCLKVNALPLRKDWKSNGCPIPLDTIMIRVRLVPTHYSEETAQSTMDWDSHTVNPLSAVVE